jgi:hypothetical protein
MFPSLDEGVGDTDSVRSVPDPVSETSSSLAFFRKPDNERGTETSNFEYCTPSPEPFRIHLLITHIMSNEIVISQPVGRISLVGPPGWLHGMKRLENNNRATQNYICIVNTVLSLMMRCNDIVT